MARRRNPFPALVVVALLPALALGGCWQFAKGRAPEGVSVPDDTVTPDSTGSSTPADVSLATPVLSLRRAPAMLARDVNLASFVATAQGFLPQIDSTSCVAISVDGQPVASQNADLPLRPASTVKVVTASVALEVLGADYTYTTEVRGNLAGGVVQGNLYLVGGGDPVLSNSWWNGPNAKYPPFNTTSIESLADAIVAAGVTSIGGSVVGDASRYDSEWYAPTWGSDVRFTEGGPITALLANDSREALDRSSNDPVVGAATVLTQLLQERGVTVGGPPAAGTTDGSAAIAAVQSHPLRDILAEMLTTSDNNTAEMILKEIGLVAGGAGTREAGLAVVTTTLQGWGIPLDGVVLVDGSGLSDENRLTCGTLLALIQRAPVDGPIGQGMAIAGQAGGTLSDAFEDTALAGLLRGKTGTLYNYDDGIGGKPAAKALCGYVPQEGGGAIQFAILLNGPQIAEKVEYRPIWDAFGAVLLSYPSGPTVADLTPR
ncbi:MAG: D-alanyl-D-alanine carboxypeptidase/D-alanyl-D-alanine-endopeptidase [Ilumatobacteraceae bacterium]